MTFEEIFKQDGLYKADSFAPGVAFKIEGGTLKLVTYLSPNDILPSVDSPCIYSGLFSKDYTKVYNIKSLFDNK